MKLNLVFLYLCALILAACSDQPKDQTCETSSMMEDSVTEASTPAPPPTEETPDTPIDAGEVSNVEEDPLAGLKLLPIAYETPNEATSGVPFDVTLAIDASGDDSAVEGLPGTERVEEAMARLSKEVEATLSGASFDIKLTTSARQTLSPVRESVWRWSVTPLSPGEQNLYLEIHALVGPDQTMMLESYSDLITVAVAKSSAGLSADSVRTYISILGGIISIILGSIALMAHLKNRKKKENKDTD